MDVANLFHIGMVNEVGSGQLKESIDESRSLREHEEVEWQQAWDGVSGDSLGPQMVREARKEEVEYFHKMKVRKNVPIQECWDKINTQPIGVRWVDINKQDDVNPKFRSRLVAKEVSRSLKPELYVATPPLECPRIATSSVMGPIAVQGSNDMR